MLYLDLDGFKQVNDMLGHAVEDEVLRTVVAAASAAVRDGDLVGRIGGDEFAALLPRTGGAEAVAVAERVRGAAERAVRARAELPRITVSVGAATYPDDASGWEELLAAADERLLEAKERPRGGRDDAPRGAGGPGRPALGALPPRPQAAS